MKELERRRQGLLERYKQKKRGSDSSQDSQSPGKKSSVGSMEVLLSPPLAKRAVRLQEYQEATAKTSGELSSEEPTPRPPSAMASNHHHHHHHTPSPTPHHYHASSPTPQQHGNARHSNEKITEMERRVKEELEAELTTHGHTHRRGDEHFKSSTGIGGTSPLHSTHAQDLPGRSPMVPHSDKRISTSSSSSPSAAPAQPAFTSGSHFTAPTSPPTSHSRKTGSGFADCSSGARKKPPFSQSDSNEWTEFASASVSGSSVEVGGGGARPSFPLYAGSHPPGPGGSQSGDNMSEFDPIKTASSSTSTITTNSGAAGGSGNSDHPSRPSMTN